DGYEELPGERVRPAHSQNEHSGGYGLSLRHKRAPHCRDRSRRRAQARAHVPRRHPGGGGAMRHLLGFALCVVFPFASVGANAQTLSASPSSVTTGQGVSATVTATWSSISAPTSTDWIALYPVGAADNAFISYRYTTGTASGDAPFTVPSTVAAGTYELRLFSNNVYTLLATSGSFTVTNPPPANLSESSSSVYAGLSVGASWSSIFSPTATDWIALYPVGAPDNAFLVYRYTDLSPAHNHTF